jgi:DNA-directed RNA polymerase subunit RPC12/RpoP
MSKVRDYFGLSKEDIKNILEDQEYKCSICDKDLGDDVNVDHCHLYNEVRAILCTHCNLGLGHFKDNPEAPRELGRYSLRSFKESRLLYWRITNGSQEKH